MPTHESTIRTSPPQELTCIHAYLRTCKTNPQPPGLADFLRGTVALHQLCRAFGYSLKVDSSIHPLFRFLEPHPGFVALPAGEPVHEFLPTPHSCNYDVIHGGLLNMFRSGQSFNTITNSFYRNAQTGALENWGAIDPACREFMRSLLRPNRVLRDAIHALHLPDRYRVIHLRFGDRFLNEGAFDARKMEYAYSRIRRIMQQLPQERFVLLSDSAVTALKLKDRIPELTYWNSRKTHLGDLKNSDGGVQDTLADFFVLSRASALHCTGWSGFSAVASVVFDLPRFVDF